MEVQSNVIRDTSQPLDDEINCISFNQDYTSIQLGTKKGCRIFIIKQDGSSSELQDQEIQPITALPTLPYTEIFILERLFLSALILVVTQSERRTLRACHMKNGSEICAIPFPGEIHSIKLNRERLAVCLERSIHIFNMTDMRRMHVIEDDITNSNVMALSIAVAHPYLAYPKSSITGEIVIFNTMTLRPISSIMAHKSNIVVMQFDKTGTMLATASSQGTIIRVHKVPGGNCLYELRRRLIAGSIIYSLAFSPDGTYLASSADTGTIHIFRLVNDTVNQPEKPTSILGSIFGLANGMAKYIPGQAGEVFTQERACATVHSTFTTMRTVIGINTSNTVLKLYILCIDGTSMVYEVNTVEGGECRLISQTNLHTLLQDPMQQASFQPRSRARITRTEESTSETPKNEHRALTTPENKQLVEDFHSMPGERRED